MTVNRKQSERFRNWVAGALVVVLGLPCALQAQSVGLPLPRLLTTTPMGGQVGSQVEIKITGENLEEVDQMVFSEPRITAKPKLNDAGQPETDKFVVSIAADCPPGLYETRVMSRLGISSSRAFSVGILPEQMQTKANTSITTAIELPVNSVVNAALSSRAADHYAINIRKGQRIVVDCAARGIDSKLDPVLIMADSAGRDLAAERRGGALDYVAPEDGRYIIKVHELTFNGGPAYYYRLAVTELPLGAPLVRMPSSKAVNACSWPPAGLKEQADTKEIEPNNDSRHAQRIALPCDIAGSFFPAADVDMFEFGAKKGEVWWIEVGSERLGLPTDPAVLVQKVDRSNDGEKLTDVTEFSDIPSPVKVSSNGYAYDGPPYNAGSSDVLGKLEIPEDGLYRLQLTDLFGGTRKDPRNIYRLVIRKAAPDFALAAWGLHMELRNGDRNAVSKPLALRGGATMALEVVAIRRDGFNGDIELAMEELPEGVVAHGLKIPAGQTRGLMLVSAREDAQRGVANVQFTGRATIEGQVVSRRCQFASMAFPIPDAWNEIPSPRLVADVPVSVSGRDYAPLTLSAKPSSFTIAAGSKLTIPLIHHRRSDFSAATLQLKTMGVLFERTPQFDVQLTADSSQAVLDTGALKVPPGDYLIAFYGGAVAKYRHHPEAIALAEIAQKKAEQEVQGTEGEVKKLAETAQNAPPAEKPAADQALEAGKAKHKSAAAKLAEAVEQVKKATAAANPTDIVDIVVSEPISIRVTPAEQK